jgi:hypothetical protein
MTICSAVDVYHSVRPNPFRAGFLKLAASLASRLTFTLKEQAMSRFKTFIVMLLFFAALQPSFADDNARIQGAWKLVSYEVEVQSTGEIMLPMGKSPTGYVMFSPESRVWFVLTGDGRKPAKTAEEKAALLDSLIAYAGKYRLEGDKWITSVEVAWNPAWVDTEQTRPFKIEGKRLQVLTPWRVMPNWTEKGMTRSIITFERVSST